MQSQREGDAVHARGHHPRRKRRGHHARRIRLHGQSTDMQAPRTQHRHAQHTNGWWGVVRPDRCNGGGVPRAGSEARGCELRGRKGSERRWVGEGGIDVRRSACSRRAPREGAAHRSALGPLHVPDVGHGLRAGLQHVLLRHRERHGANPVKIYNHVLRSKGLLRVDDHHPRNQVPGLNRHTSTRVGGGGHNFRRPRAARDCTRA